MPALAARAAGVGDTVSVPAFLNKEKNLIDFNGADWSPLFAEMDSLQSGYRLDVPRVVSIVHIGDSHVQAGLPHRGGAGCRCNGVSAMPDAGWWCR